MLWSTFMCSRKKTRFEPALLFFRRTNPKQISLDHPASINSQFSLLIHNYTRGLTTAGVRRMIESTNKWKKIAGGSRSILYILQLTCSRSTFDYRCMFTNIYSVRTDKNADRQLFAKLKLMFYHQVLPRFSCDLCLLMSKVRFLNTLRHKR